MSSSNHARVSSRADRRTKTENSAQPRAPSEQQGRSSRTERPDSRRTQSPTGQPGASHKRGPSGSQRTSRAVEERRTDRVQVTTRETITRMRSPERRSAPAPPLEKQRPPELARTYSNDPRPRSSRAETPQGTQCGDFNNCTN
jgi:gamma-tubulin complex component 2